MNSYKAVVKYAGDDLFIGIPPSGHAQVMDARSERSAGPTAATVRPTAEISTSYEIIEVSEDKVLAA